MHSGIAKETQTEALAVPLLPDQIEAACRLHWALPGWTATERAFEELQRALPGYCEEIASMVVFLASGKCDYMTGQTVFIKGGIMMWQGPLK